MPADAEIIKELRQAIAEAKANGCLLYTSENEDVEVIFSHFHAIDLQMHMIVRYMSDKGENKLPPEEFQKFAEDIYKQTDYYVGKFIHLLDEGWTLTLMSDHAQVCPAHEFPLIGDIVGVNIRVMQEDVYKRQQ